MTVDRAHIASSLPGFPQFRSAQNHLAVINGWCCFARTWRVTLSQQPLTALCCLGCVGFCRVHQMEARSWRARAFLPMST